MDEREAHIRYIPEQEPDLIKSPVGNANGADIFISLYLILLAFFVVMNSVSNQEQVRAQAVIASVNTAFKKTHLAKSDMIDLAARSQLDAPSDKFSSDVQGLLAGMIDFPGKYPSQGGNIIRVDVPPDTIFIRHQAKVRYDQSAFFDAMADLLVNSTDGEERMIEIIIGSGKNLPDDEKMWKNLYVRRAATFAKELQSRGVPSHLISTGVAAISSDRVWMSFLSRTSGEASHIVTGGG